MASGGRANDNLVCRGWDLEGGRGSLGCDFPSTSFPDRPSIRLRRLVEGFLLKPILACEEVLWRSSLAKLGSLMSPRGSSDGSNWLNSPNSSSNWSNSMTNSLPSSFSSSVFVACGAEDPKGSIVHQGLPMEHWSGEPSLGLGLSDNFLLLILRRNP